jgi:hypothetical protein
MQAALRLIINGAAFTAKQRLAQISKNSAKKTPDQS